MERAAVYADRLGSPWSPLAFTFVDGPPAAIAPARLREQGFMGVDKQLSLPLPKVLLNNHPWYRKVSLHGARWQIFQAALARLAALQASMTPTEWERLEATLPVALAANPWRVRDGRPLKSALPG